jgi:AcrR family transcriptional regulator
MVFIARRPGWPNIGWPVGHRGGAGNAWCVGHHWPMRVDALRNRERLLTAARDEFVEQGVDVALEDIAQRAGVGIATLYRRFPDRGALLRAVALYVLVQVAAEARAALAEEADSFRALTRYLHRSLDLRIAAVMPVLDGRVEIEHDDELKRARDELASLFEAIVRAAWQSGQLRTDIGPGDIGLMVIRLARPLPGAFSREFDDTVAHRQLDIMLDGLRGQHARGTTPGLSLDEVRGRRAD